MMLGTSAEWSALLECASSQFDPNRFKALLQGARWAKLLRLAEGHGVVNLLALRLPEAAGVTLPDEVHSKLLESQRQQLLLSLGLISEMLRALQRFGDAGVPALVLKGPALSLQAYGDATVRQYGDIDILVRHEDVFRATQTMIEAGFAANVPSEAIASGKIPGEYFFARPNTNVVLEVHTERTLRYFPHRLSAEDLFARSGKVEFEGRELPTLGLEDALVAMCTHGAKHFWERLMWIADVAALVTRQHTLDWDAARHIAGTLGAQRIVNTGLLFAMDLLRLKLPPQVERAARQDSGASALVAKVLTWLPGGDGASSGLLGRAVFRAQMRGGFWPGIRYVTRLSLSPTEQDWREGRGQERSDYRDTVRRLVRLAGKYGRNPHR
jgi:hypothetical protein